MTKSSSTKSLITSDSSLQVPSVNTRLLQQQQKQNMKNVSQLEVQGAGEVETKKVYKQQIAL
jgi:hypothetical protein